MDIIGLINVLPKVMDFVLKLTLLGIAIFFGRIAISGWRTKLDFITRIVGTIILGFICFSVGLLLPFEFVPQIKFISEMINSFIVAVFFYISLSLLSYKSKEGVAKKDIFSILNEIKFLKREVARINKALIDKGIQPKPLTISQVKEKLSNIFKKRYQILSSELKDDIWHLNVKSNSREYFIQLDAFSGDVLTFKKKGFDFSEIFDRLKKDKFFLAGSIMLVLFTLFVFSLLTPENISRVSETFSFYGVVEKRTFGCLEPYDVLKMWNSNESVRAQVAYDVEKANSVIQSSEGGFSSPFLYDNQVIISSNGTFALFMVTDKKVNSLQDSLIALQSSLVSGEGKICSLRIDDYSLCGCVSLSEPRMAVEISSFLNSFKVMEGSQ